MNLPRLAYFVFAFTLIAGIASAQSQLASDGSNTDTIDIRAFSVLFRLESQYLQKSKITVDSGGLGSQTSSVIPALLQLTSDETASLEQAAALWQTDTAVTRAQLLAQVQQFHASFPNGQLAPSTDPTPPAII